MEGNADDSKKCVDGGKVVDRPKMAEVPMNYTELRRLAYPKIEDQLDALWKGGAEAEGMRAQIQSIKAQFPKK